MDQSAAGEIIGVGLTFAGLGTLAATVVAYLVAVSIRKKLRKVKQRGALGEATSPNEVVDQVLSALLGRGTSQPG